MIRLIDKYNLRPISIVRWICPPTGKLKLNTDCCSKGNPDPSTNAAILRNDQGCFISASCAFIGYSNNLISELRAIIIGLRLCRNQNHHEIIVESDCLPLITMINNTNAHIPWILLPWWNDFLLLRHSVDVHFQHIVREGNKVADALANFCCAAQISQDFYSTSTLPPMVRGDIMLDKTGLPHVQM